LPNLSANFFFIITSVPGREIHFFPFQYELIQTEDLPKLGSDSKFSPGVIRDVAKNILAFLVGSPFCSP
jgi:hypothetical protein